MKQFWQIVYYTSKAGNVPVRDFLDAAAPSVKSKIFRILMTVSEYGLKSIIPHIKKIKNTPVWEIRIFGRQNAGILFVTQVGKQIILLHAFYKKKTKTPKKEISIALSRLKELNI